MGGHILLHQGGLAAAGRPSLTLRRWRGERDGVALETEKSGLSAAFQII